MEKIRLGSEVRDVVSEFTGIATARVEYLNGCVQYCVSAKSVDNKKGESLYFDEQQLSVIDDGITLQQNSTGGPSMYCPPV